MTAGGPGPVDEGDDKGGLRAALSGLTTRGRSFLAAGVAARAGTAVTRAPAYQPDRSSAVGYGDASSPGR